MYSANNKNIKNSSKILKENVPNDQETIHQNKDNSYFMKTIIMHD
jgi:hypothetical protein